MSGKRNKNPLPGTGDGIVLKEPLSTVCHRGSYLPGDTFGRNIETKYQIISMRITTSQLLFLQTARETGQTVPTAVVQRSQDHLHLDIRAAAELRMQVINAVTEHISSTVSYCPSYQDMVFYRFLLDRRQHSHTANYNENVLIRNEAAGVLFFRLIQEAYLAAKRGGRAGISYWMKDIGFAGDFAVTEEEDKDNRDSYLLRRFETEVLSYLRRQQEVIQDEAEVTRSFHSEELYHLRREAEVLKETGIYQQQEESLREQHMLKLREEVLKRSTAEVHRAVEDQVVQRLDSLSDKVYGKLEKRMENEKKRRGI